MDIQTITLERQSNNFDLIRLLAALFVIYNHSFAIIGAPEKDFLASITNNAYKFSYLGVVIFFTISGYLICQSIEHTKDGLAFIIKRFLRIFPGLFVLVLVTALVLGPIVTTLKMADYFSHSYFKEYFKSINVFQLKQLLPGVFENNPYKGIVNGSLWTLTFEVTMYIIILICSFMKIINIKSWIFKTAIVYVTYLFLIKNDQFIPGEYLWNYMSLQDLISFGRYFMIGSCYYIFRDQITYTSRNFIFALLLLYISFYYFDPMNLLRLTFVPYIIFYLSFQKSYFNTFGKYGDYSYGMYIYSFPIQQLIVYYFGNNIPSILMFIASITLTFPLAYLSWKFVEAPSLKLKKWLS